MHVKRAWRGGGEKVEEFIQNRTHVRRDSEGVGTNTHFRVVKKEEGEEEEEEEVEEFT